MPLKEYPYGFLFEGLKADGLPPPKEGVYCKFVDSGEVFFCHLGGWHPYGLGLSYAPPTKSGVVTSDKNGDASVHFGTQFIDDDYTIALSCKVKNIKRPVANWVTKDKEGFTLHVSNPIDGTKVSNVDVSWLCTRNFNE